MRRVWVVVLVTALACRASEQSAGVTAPASMPEVLADLGEREIERVLDMSPLPAVPDDPTNAVYADPRAARLGQYLFHDERLSKDGATSCATCHDPAASWADGRPLGQGVTRLDRNTISLWNVAHNRWFFWDGRADSLWAQALVPLEHPLEHASSRLQIAHVVHADPELRSAYEGLFGPLPDLDDQDRFPPVGRPVSEREIAWIEDLVARNRDPASLAPEHRHRAGTHFVHPHQRAWDTMRPADQQAVTRVFTNVGKAIAAFERELVAGSSPFDRFVAGLRSGDPEDLAALDESARRGLALFVGRARCHICHHGPTLSDLEFHDIGAPPSPEVETDDPGRWGGIEQLRESEFHGMGPWSDDPDGAGRERIAFLPTHAHGGNAEFKTPTLRNVALSAPYMHQGQFPTLDAVLDHYSTMPTTTAERVLVPLELSEREKRDLLRFLESLTGTGIDPELLERPSSPLAP